MAQVDWYIEGVHGAGTLGTDRSPSGFITGTSETNRLIAMKMAIRRDIQRAVESCGSGKR